MSHWDNKVYKIQIKTKCEMLLVCSVFPCQSFEVSHEGLKETGQQVIIMVNPRKYNRNNMSLGGIVSEVVI